MSDDMSNIMNQINNMINNNQIPDDIKNIISNISQNSQNSNEKNSSDLNNNVNDNINNSSTSSSSQTDSSSSSNPFPDFDIETMLKMKKIMESMNSTKDDPRSNLLRSLKPYLKESRKDKVEQYIKLFSMGKVFEMINPLGGENKK